MQHTCTNGLQNGKEHISILMSNNKNIWIKYINLLQPLLFLIYVNDLSKSASDKSSSILFADDTSFITANHNETEFKLNTNEIFNEINKWFDSNLLMLNYNKTYFLQFLTKTDHEINPINAELNLICHLLVLFGADHILHISSIRVNMQL
jgi:hypothetical protein